MIRSATAVAPVPVLSLIAAGLIFVGDPSRALAQEAAPPEPHDLPQQPSGSASAAAVSDDTSAKDTAAKDTPAADTSAPAKNKSSLSLQAMGISTPESPAPIDFNASSPTRTAGNYLWPLLDTLGINLTLWAIPYAAGVPFAQVNPTYWKNNLQTGLQWDDNEFEVNQFAHPWQGGMYFTTARVNGLSFWEAIPYTVLGSLSWEYFAETEQPSTNDFMTTTWGGVFAGEALFRLSNSVLDETVSGSQRFWREFAAFAINPVNGVDRVISGRAWANGAPSKKIPLAGDLRVGPDGIGLSDGTGWGKTIRTYIRFDYGDLYAKPNISVPFEYFNLSAQISFGKSILGEGFDGTGVLLGHRFSMGDNNVDLFAWVLSYGYFTNGTTKMTTRESENIYQLGEMGTGPSWFGHWGLAGGFSVDSEIDLLAVPTGAITSPYAKYEANRSYSYGLGGALKAEINLRQERWGRLYAKANRYLYGIVDGARGAEHVGVFEVGAYANLYKGHGLGFGAIRYDRNSYYSDYPDFFDHFWSGQFHYELEY